MTATLTYIGPRTELCGVVELVADIVHVGRWTADGEGVQVVEQRTAGPNCVIVIKEEELYIQYPEILLSGRQFTVRRIRGESGDTFTIENVGTSGRTYLNGERIERCKHRPQR